MTEDTLEDYFEDEYDYESSYLSEEELAEIQDDYRKRQLIQHLIGPAISTVIHAILIILLLIYLVFPAEEDEPEIEAEIMEEEVIEIEEPEEPEEIVEVEDTKTDSPTPEVTTPAVETESDDVSMEDVSDEVAETEDNVDMEEVSDVKIMDTPFKSSALYGGRTASGRSSALKKYGGSQKGQDALLKSLYWLRDHQNPDGSWGKFQKEAMTGLAVLTFLAHGELPSSKHFGKCVKKGISWIVKTTMNNKGKILGKQNKGGDTRSIYSHALMTYALSEAYAMIGMSEIGEAMEAATKVIVDGQMENGGFFYGYAKDSDDNLSNASFNFQALKASYIAGCQVEGLKKAIEKSIGYLKRIAGPNHFYYRSNGKKTARGPSMRCVGTLCLQLLGEHDSEIVKRMSKYIGDNDIKFLKWEAGKGNEELGFPLYFWYYGTQVMYQKGGNYWKLWNKKFQALLVKHQFKDGHWESPSTFESRRFGMQGIDDKVYSTTLCGLMLTVYYRHLPSYKIKPPKKDAKKEGPDNEDVELIIE